MPNLNRSENFLGILGNESNINEYLKNLVRSFNDESQRDVKDSNLDVRNEHLPSNFTNSEINDLKKSYEELYLNNNPQVGEAVNQVLEKSIDSILERYGPEYQKFMGKIRVVILKNTNELSAFAASDKTVFITQRLINELGSLDALMGVLFHEVSHIINNDFGQYVNYTTNPLGIISRRFTEEIAADVEHTPRLLEIAGLNPKGLKEALRRIEEATNQQGGNLDYRGMTERQFQQDVVASKQYFTNTSQAFKPLPEIFRQESRYSNKELLEILKSKDYISYLPKEISKILPLLSKSNLYEEFSIINHHLNYDTRVSLKKSILKYIEKTLENKGYSKEEIFYFLFCQTTKEDSEESLNIKHLPSYLDDFKKNFFKLEGGEINKNNLEMKQLLFGDIYPIETNSVDSEFIRKIVNSTCPRGRNDKNQYEINDSDLVSLLENYFDFFKQTTLDASTSKEERDSKEKKFTEIIFNCMTNFYDAYNIHLEKEKNTIQKKLIENEIKSFTKKIINSSLYPKIESKLRGFLRHQKNFRRYEYFNLGKIIQRAIIESKKNESFEETVRDIIKKLSKLAKKVPSQFLEFINKSPQSNYEEVNLNDYLEKIKKLGTKEFKSNFIDLITGSDIKEEEVPIVFNFLDNLEKYQPDFYKVAKDEFGISIYNYIMNGIPLSMNSTNQDKIFEDSETNRQLAIFNLKLNILIYAFKKDNPEFYKHLQKIFEELPIDTETLNESQFYRLIYPIPSTIQVLNPEGFSNTLILNRKLANGKMSGFGPESQFGLYGFGVNVQDFLYSQDMPFHRTLAMPISNYEELESIPQINNFLEKSLKEELGPEIDSIDKFYDAIKNAAYSYNNLRDYNKPQEITIPIIDIYDDDFLVLTYFAKYRKRFIELLENTEQKDIDFLKLGLIVKAIFPEGNEKDLIIKNIYTKYILSNDDFSKKVDFFYENFDFFDQESLNTLVEQIEVESDNPGEYWSKWSLFYLKFKTVLTEIKNGQRNISRAHLLDTLTNSSALFDSFSFIDTIDPSTQNKVSQSNQIADIWNKTFLRSRNRLRDEVTYDEKRELFHLSSTGRQKFISVKDLFEKLRNIPTEKKYLLIRKELVNTKGPLASPEKRGQLARKLINSLGITDDFISQFIKNLTLQAEQGTENRNVFVNIFASMVYEKMFSSLDIDSIDKESGINRLAIKPTRQIISFGQIFKENIISTSYSFTREINSYRQVEERSNPKLLSRFVEESEHNYEKVLNNLLNRFDTEIVTQPKENIIEGLPSNMSILISALESTTLGTRGLQITKQMRNFENPLISQRLAMSFDANEGMNKLDFLLALQSASERDEKLLDFLKNNLIRIKKKLGKGSMAATYDADILDRNQQAVSSAVLRCIKPGAEDEVISLSKAVLTALNEIISTKKKFFEGSRDFRVKLTNAKLAKIVTQLAEEWCVKDIQDQNYEVNDDIFRQRVIDEYNKLRERKVVVAPQRIYTSWIPKDSPLPPEIKNNLGFIDTELKESWVRVEEKAEGISLREFLDSPDIPSILKKKVVNEVYEFNRFQYSKENLDEKNIGMVQSDPSIGNYLIEIIEGEPLIHVLDRGLMIQIDGRKIEIVDKLLEGNFKEFLNLFTDEIVDYNSSFNTRYQSMSSQELSKIKSSLKKSIIIEVLKTKIFKRIKTSSDYLTIINQILVDKKVEFPLDLQLILKNNLGLELLKTSWS